MMLSFAAYIASFALFGLAEGVALLFAAMALFGVGEAFRTGTHKAMIFTWLRLEGRTDDRTRVYGYTRSWSKYGSALSVVLAAVFVYYSDSYCCDPVITMQSRLILERIDSAVAVHANGVEFSL